MTKLEWFKRQIELAFKKPPATTLIPRIVAAVEAAGEDISRSAFLELVESFEPAEIGREYDDYEYLNLQLAYAADFSEVWTIEQAGPLPLIETQARHGEQQLPADFIKLGGEPDWVQDEDYPICDDCDRNMVLFAQIKSLPGDITLKNPDLRAYEFGDLGTFYVFACPDCWSFKNRLQCG